jgi:hypothetical protein
MGSLKSDPRYEPNARISCGPISERGVNTVTTIAGMGCERVLRFDPRRVATPLNTDLCHLSAKQDVFFLVRRSLPGTPKYGVSASPANGNQVQFVEDAHEFRRHKARGPEQSIPRLSRQTEDAVQPVRLVGVTPRPPPTVFDVLIGTQPFAEAFGHHTLAQADSLAKCPQ